MARAHRPPGGGRQPGVQIVNRRSGVEVEPACGLHAPLLWLRRLAAVVGIGIGIGVESRPAGLAVGIAALLLGVVARFILLRNKVGHD